MDDIKLKENQILTVIDWTVREFDLYKYVL
jgi:hypothetical protein